MSASHRFLHRAAALLSSAALAFGLSCASAIPAFADATAPCQLTDDQREAYEADGTLDQRLARAEELGHDRPSKELIAQARQRESGVSPQENSVPSNWAGGMPTEGEAHVIALYVDFPAGENEPAYTFEEGDTLEALDALIDGGSGTFPYEDLASYYFRSSYGALEISGDTYAYTAQHPRSYYEGYAYDADNGLFVEALRALDESIDYTDYDGDQDGYIDAVYLHFAGPNYGWMSMWWSQEFKVERDDLSFDGVGLSNCVMLHNPSNDPAGYSTIIHETGHALGLPDYYNATAQTQYGAWPTGIIGSDIMMDNVRDTTAGCDGAVGSLRVGPRRMQTGYNGARRIRIPKGVPMPHTVLPDIPSGELKERLARVRYVFTDLDGTMLAPGSCALTDAAGNPSLDLVTTLVDLKRAGIEVIPCSGRNRSMLHEDSRVFGLNSYIGEMGGLLMLDRNDSRWEYFTADMPFNPIWGFSPHECIEATGILEEFSNRWPGLLEYHNDMSTGYKHREVTVGLRGEIPDEEARDIIRRSGAELDWGDNGYLNYISAPTTLKLPEGVKGRAFNIMPQGLNKGRGIERFCELRGIDLSETLAIGDATSDFLMADYVDTFFLVENGLKNPTAEEFLASHDNAFVTRGRIVDGWVQAMRCVLTARG